MKKVIGLVLLITVLLSVHRNVDAQEAAGTENEKQEVKELIQKAIDAMYNEGDVDKIKTYYHEGYELYLMLENNQLYKMSLNDRIEYVEKDKKSMLFPPKEKVSITFDFIDIAVSTATVKFDYFRDDRNTCIDIMTLYKFKEGWRIVTQTTHHIQD